MDRETTDQLQALAQSTLQVARSLVTTRAELDAMRLLCTAFFAVSACDPEIEPQLVATLQAVFDADHAIALNSEATDDLLEERAKWLRRLTPTHLHSKLRFP